MFYESQIEFSPSREPILWNSINELNSNALETVDTSFDRVTGTHREFIWEKIQRNERKKFLNLPFAKYNSELKKLIISNIILEDVFFECIKEINSSSGAFALDIQSLKIDLENNLNNTNDEIVIKIKVPKESQEDIVDQFWNCVSVRVHDIMKENITEQKLADEIFDNLFVIVNDD